MQTQISLSTLKLHNKRLDELIDRHKDIDEFEKELEKYKDEITPGQVGES